VAASLDALLREGIAAARAGQAAQARTLLLRVVEADQRNVQAWYWLSRVADAPEEREICLENVLALDPAHTAVQAQLAELRRRMARAPAAPLHPTEAGEAAIPRTALEQRAADAAVEPLRCPYCGAETGAHDRQCAACGQALTIKKPRRADHSVYSMGLVAAWFALANHVWLALTAYYFVADLSSAAGASPGLRSALQVLGGLLGLEGGEVPLAGVPLAPILLAGAAIALFSLVVAWGVYRRLRAFYWLTVVLMLFYPLAIVYQLITAETFPWVALAAEGVVFFLTLSLTFMAYDEFAWVEARLDAGVDKDVDSHSALYARGREHAARGMWAKAIAHWSRAVALSPGHPDYRLALASAYINLDQPERALNHLREAQRIEPDNPHIQKLLESTQT
jgi:tetratricopeptide (TPR) repeat protein